MVVEFPRTILHTGFPPQRHSPGKNTLGIFLLSPEPLQNHLKLPPLLIVRVQRILSLTLFDGKGSYMMNLSLVCLLLAFQLRLTKLSWVT